MSQKKKISKLDLFTYYMDFVSEFGMRPNSVEELCNQAKIKEEDFEEHFSSFKKIEKAIFKELFKNSLEVLVESEEFNAFDGKNKLLSLYFTFFENLNLNRPYIIVILKGCKNQLNSLKLLRPLKKQFFRFVTNLALTDAFLPIDGLEKLQQNFINQSAWIQFLATMKFWLEDQSESCEKTDIFIEKSINTSFELIENKFIKNAFDLGKFIYKETFQNKD